MIASCVAVNGLHISILYLWALFHAKPFRKITLVWIIKVCVGVIGSYSPTLSTNILIAVSRPVYVVGISIDVRVDGQDNHGSKIDSDEYAKEDIPALSP